MSYQACRHTIPLSSWLIVEGLPFRTVSTITGIWKISDEERYSPWASTLEDVNALARVVTRMSRDVIHGMHVVTGKRFDKPHGAALFIRFNCPQHPVIHSWGRRLKDEMSMAAWEQRWTDERFAQLVQRGQAA